MKFTVLVIELVEYFRMNLLYRCYHKYRMSKFSLRESRHSGNMFNFDVMSYLPSILVYAQVRNADPTKCRGFCQNMK